MCTTSGKSCGTAEVIYEKMNQALEKNNIPWANCVSLSIDNAPVNTGPRNSIASRILRQNTQVYIHGCPCHIIHNTAKQAGLVFSEVSVIKLLCLFYVKQDSVFECSKLQFSEMW